MQTLREACNAINAAAASNATLIDADPEKKETIMKATMLWGMPLLPRSLCLLTSSFPISKEPQTAVKQLLASNDIPRVVVPIVPNLCFSLIAANDCEVALELGGALSALLLGGTNTYAS